MVKSWKLALAVSALMLSAPSLNSALQDDGMQMGTGPSEDYYDGTDGLHGVELHEKLYDIVRNHTVVSYYSAWDHLRYVDEDPENSENVILFYMQRSHSEEDTCGDGNDCTSESWNREHVWPKSHGDFGTTMSKVAGTDLHALRPVDNTVNSARSDKDFGEAEDDHSECTECDASADAWEPSDVTKGDAARSVFYMDLRYNGFGDEPALSLVNSWTEPSEDEGYLGKICTLYSWHYNDPVSDFEMERNNRVYEIQGNRNPFVDNADFVEGIWGEVCDEWGNGAIEYTDDLSSFEIGPSDRTAMLTAPGGHDFSRPLPLVVSLHGFSGNGWLNSYWMDLFQSTHENEHLLLWPNGTANSAGVRFWNATDACCNFEDIDSDDVEWLTALIDEAVSLYGADPDGIILVGHSNGGFMSHRMACERGQLIRSIVNMGGSNYNDFANDCQDTGRPNILNVHGTLDTVIWYNGGILWSWGGLNQYPSATLSTSFWADRSGCDVSSTEMGTLDLDSLVFGEETTMDEHLNCEDGNRVALWSIESGGHTPVFNEGSFAEETLDWSLDGFVRDSDGDGHRDDVDVFHLNPYEWEDSDADGVGDNSDAFPMDSTEAFDSDGDGIGDNADRFPYDSSEISDLDDDGIGDNSDLDDDNDGWSDEEEASCQTDPADSGSLPLDTDSDGECDANDEDDDNDGWSDEEEAACQTDPADSGSLPLDTDSDGECDANDEDDDGDGVDDWEDEFPLDPAETVDTDDDGIGDNADTDDDDDGWPDENEASCGTDPQLALDRPADTDSDGECDANDEDDDGDGVDDWEDAFPRDSSESSDNDQDGIGDNADSDDDNDMLTDLFEIEQGTDPLLPDTDGDGVSDFADQYPLDPKRQEERGLPGLGVVGALFASVIAAVAARENVRGERQGEEPPGDDWAGPGY